MGPLLLILTTFIWGTAFLAQKVGASSLGPFAMTVYRNLLGGAFLTGLILLRRTPVTRRPVLSGVASGVPLFAAMVSQQTGIAYTTPGISAFLTTNYVLFVPFLAALLARKMPQWYIVVGAVMALTGTYFICMRGEDFAIGSGEAWTVLCALLFSIQMIVVDRLAPACDVLVMSASQLLTCVALGVPFLLLPSEQSSLNCFLPRVGAWLPLVYCGVFSSGIAYTLQNFGQARTSAGLAAILLSLESVFGALSGYVVLGDVMTTRQFVGCALVFMAAVFTPIIAGWHRPNMV